MEMPTQQPISEEFLKFASDKISDLSNRVRLLEEKFEQLREKLKATDQNLLRRTNELKELITENSIQIEELNKNYKDIRETTRHLIKEVETSAKISDLKVLEKYVDLFDPTRFLTLADAEKLFEKKRVHKKKN